jgi:hypothetical protein
MGFFGGETIYVSSVVYNMAGDLLDRPDYLKSSVVSNVISNSRFSMAETLSSSYLNGPGINIRVWHRWCKRPGKYDEVGIPYSFVADEADLTPDAVANAIPVDGSIHYVGVATYDYGAFSHYSFAQQFMLEYHYNIFTEAWTSSYDEATGLVTITRADGVSQFTFSVAGSYNPATDGDSKYIYAMYNTRKIVDQSWVNTRMFIYKIGTGNATLDELVNITSDTSDEFLPIIPIRFKGEFISGTYKPEVYAQTSRAYKKMTKGQKLAKLVDQISENEDIGDIDHAFIMHGVCVNTQEQRSLRYIVHFFERMLSYSTTSWAAYETMQTTLADWQTDWQAWQDGRSTWIDEHPGEPYPPPPARPASVTPTTSIHIGSRIGTDATDTCNIRVKWKATRKTTGTGLGKPGAKVQEVWWGPVTINDFNDEIVSLYQQDSANSWIRYEIIGLHFINEIYKGEAFKLGIKDALQDSAESAFLIPIHYDTLKSMSLVDSTQVMLSATYMVFNCYEVVKQPWYATTFFKVIIFIAMVAITVATMGAAAPGLLGAAGAVGASLGFTGLMATIVGAIANALAAMILTQMISYVSIKAFGPKIGAIIATVASVAAVTMGSSMMSGQSMTTAWSSLMSASNIINMTNAVGRGIAGYMQASAAEWAGKTQELQTEYEAATKKLQQQWIDEFGLGTFVFDPNMLTSNNPDGLTELPQSFLDRTLLTGSDIADMTNGMLSDFASLTLDMNTIGR